MARKYLYDEIVHLSVLRFQPYFDVWDELVCPSPMFSPVSPFLPATHQIFPDLASFTFLHIVRSFPWLVGLLVGYQLWPLSLLLRWFYTQLKIPRIRNQSNPQNTKNTTKFRPKPPHLNRTLENKPWEKQTKKEERKNLPKPLPSFSFFRPLLFLLPTAIYINKIQIFAEVSVLFQQSLQSCNTTRKILFK